MACTAFYELFLSPLRRYPGPKLLAISRLPYARVLLSGDSLDFVQKLHAKYGDVVRVAPNELIFNHPQAWEDIYGHRKRGELENPKDPAAAAPYMKNIINAEHKRHGEMRKMLSSGFSAQALAAQEPLIKRYIDSLMVQLRVHGESGAKPLNIVAWLNYTTFDMIGDLTFGEPFDCLGSADYQ